MSAPVTSHQSPVTSHDSLPWSPAAEKVARNRVQNAWEAMWMFIGCFVVSVILAIAQHHWAWALVAAGCFALAVFTLHELNRRRELLGSEMQRLPGGGFYEGSGMLRNKPRTTRGLTRWCNRTPAPGTLAPIFFVCECGRFHRWLDAQWIPNYDPIQFEDDGALSSLPVDPHGGRYVILCPCGLGHYKLRT